MASTELQGALAAVKLRTASQAVLALLVQGHTGNHYYKAKLPHWAQLKEGNVYHVEKFNPHRS
jgi:hypothetical protein